MDEPSIDADDVESRLYLIGPAGTADLSRRLRDELPAVLEVATPAAFLLRRGVGGRGGADGEVLAGLRCLVGEHRLAFLVEDDLDLARTLDADGMHLTGDRQVDQIRAALTEDRLLGADCDLSRDRAMVAGEQGADYVAFGRAGHPVEQAVLDLVGWWHELCVLPCLAYADGPEDAARLAEAGADFIGISSAVWRCPEGAVAGARALQAAIARK